MYAALLALVTAALASPGLDALSAGDRARYADDRATAVARYREAIDSGEPAAAAMAHLRMLSLSGNLGALVHGPAADEALARAEGPWGQLARADYHLLAPAFVGAEPERGQELAEALLDALPGPAAARLYLATGEARWLEQLRALPPEERDGLAEAMAATGRRLPPDPGTWFLGLGLSGAPGQGLGGGLIFQNPDLGRERRALSLGAAATSRGSLSGEVSLRGPRPLHAELSLSGYHLVADRYTDGEPRAYTQAGAAVRAGPGYRLSLGPGRADIRLAAQARVDDLGAGPEAVYGPVAGASWSSLRGSRGERRGAAIGLSGDYAALGDYRSALISLDGRGFVGALGGALGGRLTWRGAPEPDTPFYRLPSAGGATFLRGAWAGRYRAERITSADIEQRWALGAALEAVIFADAAWVSEQPRPEDAGLHYGSGLGLRLVMPPEALNIVRLDAAIGDSGWAVSAGWGEVF